MMVFCNFGEPKDFCKTFVVFIQFFPELVIIFRYDKTFEGLLTAVFDAYNRKTFPEKLIGLEDIEPLFTTEILTVISEAEKSGRVWAGLERKLNQSDLSMMSYVWLSELPETDDLIFRFIRKVFDSSRSVVRNMADADMLEMRNVALKVSREKHRMIELVRFQKMADDVFFAPVDTDHNCLPLITEHFQDRFADQKWVIYDTGRNYGYYYDLKTVTEITLDSMELFSDGKLNEDLLATDEKMFQQLWKTYFKSMTIHERLNPKLHKQHLPVRYWKYLTEKQK